MFASSRVDLFFSVVSQFVSRLWGTPTTTSQFHILTWSRRDTSAGLPVWRHKLTNQFCPLLLFSATVWITEEIKERLIFFFFGWVSSWFTLIWVNTCICVMEKQRGVHLWKQNRQVHMTCTEYRSSPTTFPCTLRLLNTTALLLVGFPPSAFLHREHSKCAFCITSFFCHHYRNSHGLGKPSSAHLSV